MQLLSILAVRRLVRTRALPSKPRPSAPAADVQSQFCRARIESSFQGAGHRRSNTGRMPIHPHDGSESLKPIRIAEPGKKRRMAVMEKNTLDDSRPELRHTVGEPGRHTATVQRQVCDAGALHTSILSGPVPVRLNVHAPMQKSDVPAAQRPATPVASRRFDSNTTIRVPV